MWCDSNFTQLDGQWNVLHSKGDSDPMLKDCEDKDTWAIFHFAGNNKPWKAGATFYNQAVRGVWEAHAQDYWGEPFVAPFE